MHSFEIIPGDPHSTVILHVPHSSTFIPADVRAGIVLDDAELETELAAITDADTDQVAKGAADLAQNRPWMFVNRASRLVVDPERFPDEREELNEVGMGAVYERTTDLRVLRTPTDDERQQLIDRFFTPYAEAIAQLVRDRLAAVGRVAIIDVHSFPVSKLPYELHGGGPRPEICIGTDDFHTTPGMRAAANAAMTAVGETAMNSPFSGCYVPLDQYQQNELVLGVMLEIRRDIVTTRMSDLQAATSRLVDLIDGDTAPSRPILFDRPRAGRPEPRGEAGAHSQDRQGAAPLTGGRRRHGFPPHHARDIMRYQGGDRDG